MNEGERSLFDACLFFWRSKYVIASTIVALILLALLASVLMTPMYRAEGTYQYIADLESKGISGIGGGSALGNLAAGLSGGLFSSDSSVQGFLETLNSRAFLISFAEEKNLAPQLFSELWDKREHEWKNPNKVPSGWEISERLASRISTTLNSKTGLISIAVTWDDPEAATDLLIDFVIKANSDFRVQARERTMARLEYLTTALADSNMVEVKVSIADLIRGEVERNMMISIENEYAFRTLSPPVSPDHDAYVSPNRSLFVISATFFGFFLGLLISYARELFQKYSQTSSRDAA